MYNKDRRKFKVEGKMMMNSFRHAKSENWMEVQRKMLTYPTAEYEEQKKPHTHTHSYVCIRYSPFSKHTRIEERMNGDRP